VSACSSSPIAAVAQRLAPPAALAPDQCRSLLDSLAQIADPRHRRGRRHALGSVLAVAVAAVLAGARSLAAGVWRPPGEATVRRVLARVDPDALDRAIGAWLADQQPPATRPPTVKSRERPVGAEVAASRAREWQAADGQQPRLGGTGTGREESRWIMSLPGPRRQRLPARFPRSSTRLDTLELHCRNSSWDLIRKRSEVQVLAGPPHRH
jgi:DDE_Tnp_1-associated